MATVEPASEILATGGVAGVDAKLSYQRPDSDGFWFGA